MARFGKLPARRDWVFKIFQKMPVLLHPIRPKTHKVGARMLLNLLSPEFAQEESTCYLREQQAYAMKYVREVSSDQRDGITGI